MFIWCVRCFKDFYNRIVVGQIIKKCVCNLRTIFYFVQVTSDTI